MATRMITMVVRTGGKEMAIRTKETIKHRRSTGDTRKIDRIAGINRFTSPMRPSNVVRTEGMQNTTKCIDQNRKHATHARISGSGSALTTGNVSIAHGTNVAAITDTAFLRIASAPILAVDTGSGFTKYRSWW